MRNVLMMAALGLVTIGAAAAQKKLTLKNLPADVQKTVQAELKGAEIKNITKETERGIAQFEIESLLNGKHRDFNVDSKGKLLVVEEETTMDAIPAPAKATILKKAAGGKLGMVEAYIKDGQTLYEAAYTTKSGKKRAVLVKADGTETKD